MDFQEIIPISALTGVNLDVFEKKIYEYLPETEKIYSDDEISDQSLKFLLSEIIREKVLHRVKEELPFVTAVYIDKFEDRPLQTDNPLELPILYVFSGDVPTNVSR